MQNSLVVVFRSTAILVWLDGSDVRWLALHERFHKSICRASNPVTSRWRLFPVVGVDLVGEQRVDELVLADLEEVLDSLEQLILALVRNAIDRVAHVTSIMPNDEA